MIVLVCGGRDFADYTKLTDVLDEVASWAPVNELVVINGGATGADQLSTQWAKSRGAKYIECPVARDPADAIVNGAKFNWQTHGRAAGPLRNAFMLDTHKPETAVVFPGGNGTADMLARLFQAGVECWVVGR